MFRNVALIALVFFVIGFLSCKDEPVNHGIPPATQADAPAAPAAPAGNIQMISKEKIVLNDSTEIVFPKEDDKTSMVFYFATPGQSMEGKTSLSSEGQMLAGRLSGTLAQSGLAVVYVEGNAAMQTALGVAKANACEFNIFKADAAAETLKLIAQTYAGKKVMVCAGAPIITEMMAQLTGKPAPTVPATPNNNLYVVVAKALGDGEVKTTTY